MADNPTPDPASHPPDDPDADLIAYLDGELDGPEAREVEARLALDPAARAKAEAYKKTFNLLDYLPRPEPSPDFATRTLTRVQPVLGSPSGAAPPVPAGSGARPAAGASGVAYPLPDYSGSVSAVSMAAPVVPSRPGWVVGLAWLAAGVLAAVGGYVAHLALRPYLEPPARLDLDDVRVVENLPLYVGVDDLDFLRRLDAPDLFAPDPSANTTPTDAPRPEAAPAGRDRLIALFKSYPPVRQQQLRDLDRDLHDLPAAERKELTRVLEGYAVWLDRLPDPDRKAVLAATPDARLEAVRQAKEKAWRDALPQRAREQLNQVADVQERLRLVDAWKQTEKARRDEWQLARRQWEDLRQDRTPWPFSDPALAAQVDEYVKTVLKADLATRPDGNLPAHCRLSRDEYQDLKTWHDAAKRESVGWNWFRYGMTVYRLSRQHPYLPEFGEKPPITEPGQLPREFLRDLRLKGGFLGPEKRPSRGKWPEFALDVESSTRKGGLTIPVTLGPSKPGEFKPEVSAFLTGELLPKLTAAEKGRLKKLEGKWPEYPREVLSLAHEKDLPVPGVTLPGKPSEWVKFYSLNPRKK